MGSIFIIHSSKDNEMVTEISQWLMEHGHRSMFLDFDPEKRIPPGRNWEKELNSQLGSCQAVIVLCSQHSMSSAWCFSEITHAQALGKSIFPIVVDPCTISSLLTSYQILDITQDKDIAYEQLEERLSGIAEQNKTVLRGKYGREAKDKPINDKNKEQVLCYLQKPSLNPVRIVFEILAGTAMGIAVAVPAVYVIGAFFPKGCFSGFAALGFMFLVIPPLYGIVGAVSVYLVGSIGKQTGSLLPTLGCGFLGAYGAFIPSIALLMRGKEILLIFLLPLLLIPPGMAMLGFNSTRRYK